MWIWDDKYSVGVDYIDDQHKLIIGYINLVEKIHNNLQKGLQIDSDDVANVLEKLFEYTQVHFRDEERLMRRVNFPGLDKHIEIHKHLIDSLQMLRKKYDTSGEEVLPILSEFLTKWLKSHIAQVDQKYSQYVWKKSVP